VTGSLGIGYGGGDDDQEVDMTDAITLLKADHKKVEKLFKRYEKTTDRAIATREKLIDEITTELSVHAEVEEQLLYPASRQLSDESEALTLESLEEHHLVKVTLAELSKLSPEDERFHPKVMVLMENVRHHVEEEEQELFPKLRKAYSRTELTDLGESIEAAKAIAPTRPHPSAPDAPPANVLVGAVAGVVDRVRDTLASSTGRS
jgi:hemerythrin superfamily protein